MMPDLPWDNNLLNLRDMLADLYWDIASSRRVVQQAGIKPALISFKDSAINNWHAILDYARHNPASVDALIDVAISDYPAKKDDLLLIKQHQSMIRGTTISDVHWQRPLDSQQLEKITGAQSTLLPITFLERGLHCAQSVARLDLGQRGYGSGFLVGNDLLLTNHHVLENKDQARLAKVQLNYQQTLAQLAALYDEYALDPDTLFHTSQADDWTVVKLKDQQGQSVNTKWPALALAEQNPQIDDFTIIIQHPGGGPKQIALYHNVIAYVDQRVIQYLTDTEPGSSGSPVFDTHWNVIALHHSGGWLREPSNDPKQTFYRNEGININTVIAGLKSAGVI